MLRDSRGTSNLQDSLSIQKLENIIELAEKNSGCSLTSFVLKYHKFLLLSNKTLTKVVRHMIDDGIFDYSSGGLLISPQVNTKEILSDFLQNYSETKQQPNQYQKEKDNRKTLVSKNAIVFSNDKKLQSASKEWVSFVRESELSLREANIVLNSFKTVREFLSTTHSDLLSFPACGHATARKICKFKLICEKSLNELVTSSHEGKVGSSHPRTVPSNQVKVTNQRSSASTLIDRYSAFKIKHGRIPTTNELGIKPSCALRKVINTYGGYTQYILSIEDISHDDLLEEYKEISKKNSCMSPYKIIEKYGQYPVWLYIRSFGTLKKIVRLAQSERTLVEQGSIASRDDFSKRANVENIKERSVETISNKNDKGSSHSWQDTILSFNLSIRAMRALAFNFNSLEEFINTSIEDLAKLKKCGSVTQEELKKFKTNNYPAVFHKATVLNQKEQLTNEDGSESQQPISIMKKSRAKIRI